MAANSGGSITAGTLGFFVHDEVGSIIATVTESLGGSNQAMSLTSYDAWGQARPTRGIVSPAERAVRISARLGAVQLTPATDPVADSRKVSGNRCC